MEKQIVLIGLLFMFLFIASGCNDNSTDPKDNITATQVVKKTSVNYSQETFRTSFPDTISLHSISKAYSNNYSEDLRGKIIEYMEGEVTKLGEDRNIFNNILTQTGCKLTGEYLLPTYAERAKYENQEVWILQITYGLGEPNFGHYKCFAISVVNLDTLAYEGCK